jgi:6-phospho-3-hexuloisomerase
MNAHDMSGFTTIGGLYIEYLRRVLESAEKDYNRIEYLCRLIRRAHAIHIFGFGRSGAAALAFAIRLRHFGNYLPPVWWVGDQVRQPIRDGDMVVLFSGSGTRPEVETIALKARMVSASLVLVTSSKKTMIESGANCVICLPTMNNGNVYGGGDFELGAFFLQEVLVNHLGRKLKIPRQEVELNHV